MTEFSTAALSQGAGAESVVATYAKATIHPFEAAGLGVAPFVFTGHSESVHTEADGRTRAGGSCDFCGTGIRQTFHVRSTDGRTFKVGSDCIRRVYAEFDAEVPVDARCVIADAQYQKREAKREAEWQKLRARMDVARATLAAHPDAFTDRKHPHDGLAAQGLTYRDYLDFLLSRGGADSRDQACKIIAKLAAPSPAKASVPEPPNDGGAR